MIRKNVPFITMLMRLNCVDNIFPHNTTILEYAKVMPTQYRSPIDTILDSGI